MCRSLAASSWCQSVQLGASPSMMDVTLSMMRLPLSVCSMTCRFSDSAKSPWAVWSWVGRSIAAIICSDYRGGGGGVSRALTLQVRYNICQNEGQCYDRIQANRKGSRFEMRSLRSPQPSNQAATNRMRSNRRKDTKPERALRSLLHRRGLRFRKDHPIELPSGSKVRVDIVFTKRRVAVFVDGCFWHSCPRHGTVPKSNQEYWIPKLRQNAERDRENERGLRQMGWNVLRIWEHVNPEEGMSTVLDSLKSN